MKGRGDSGNFSTLDAVIVLLRRKMVKFGNIFAN